MAMKVGGAKGGKHAARPNADMNVTPFVDVMLVLLIIFMVAAPLATTAVKVDLPPNKPAAQPPAPPPVVSIGQSGVWVSGQKSSLATLAADVANRLHSARPTAQTVLIRADADLDYGRFMLVLNQLKAAGYEKLSLIAETPARA